MAVQLGAGSIGRGLVGRLLHDSDAEIVFGDVDGELVAELGAAGEYVVRELGGGRAEVVDGFLALDVAVDEAALIDRIAQADLVTTAVGVRALPEVAPLVARGLQRRVELDLDAATPGPLAVLACENAIGASDELAALVRAGLPQAEADALDSVAVFANTVVDRIVPAQDPATGLEVLVEPYFEWVADRTPFHGRAAPVVTGLDWTDDLAPFIERKLFTLNTAHAAAAYLGAARGVATIGDALADPVIRAVVERATGETRALLVARSGLDEADLGRYGETVLQRLADPALVDSVQRVGRDPLRKLGRYDRLIGPAAALAEQGLPRDALLEAIAAALAFDALDDPGSAALARVLAAEPPERATTTITGIAPAHPLHGDLLRLVTARAARI